MKIVQILTLIILLIISANAYTKDNKIIVASSTSAYDSGLLNYLNNHFINKFNINVHVLSFGTGQSIKLAETGNADLIIVHNKKLEEKFINEGYGLKRNKFMFNDYIIVGPKNSNNKCNSIYDFFRKIIDNKYVFISRGDDSGTNLIEKKIWNNINVNSDTFTDWYKINGQGMGATLMMANELKAYTITDRGTWITFNLKENLKIICEGNPKIMNQYSIIAVNPKLHPKINFIDAQKYINWVLSDEGKELINNFKINNKQIYEYNYK